VRINFNYFIDETVFEFLVRAVAFVAEHGHRFLPDYDFDPTSGIWRHRDGPVEPPLRLADLAYDADGRLTYPHHDDRAPLEALEGYLADAVRMAAERGEPGSGAPSPLSSEVEALRWFELPGASLTAAGEVTSPR
jgi:hypothetical protein